jgi:Ca2+/H+ antiporter
MGAGEEEGVSISMYGVFVCEQMKTHLNFITQLFKELNNIMHYKALNVFE